MANPELTRAPSPFDTKAHALVRTTQPATAQLRSATRTLARGLGWFSIGLGLLIFAIIVWLRNAIPQSSLITVFIATILGQLAIASRLWTRLTIYAAELDLYRRLIPPPEDAPLPETPPGPHFPEFARASDPSEGPPPPRGLFGEDESTDSI